MANQFSSRIDRDSTLAYYGFGGWRPSSSIPILLLFVLVMNALVYWGLLPARSRLRLQEDEEEAAAMTTAAATNKGSSSTRALDFLRVSADSAGTEGKDEEEDRALRRPLLSSLPLPRVASKEGGMLSSPLPTLAPQAAAAQKQQQGGGGLRQKLLAADEKDLSIPQVLLESLTGTSDTALIDSRLNDGHHAPAGVGAGGDWQQLQQQQMQGLGMGVLDVKDYAVRSAHIQKSRGIRLLFREVVYSIPAAEPGDEQRGPLVRCLMRGRRAKQGRRVLLKGASGRVNPGEMCALMGGSGAGTCGCTRLCCFEVARIHDMIRGLPPCTTGKTTLLDVLAGRKTSGSITGEVYFNGRQGHPSPKRCSYVTQVGRCWMV